MYCSPYLIEALIYELVAQDGRLVQTNKTAQWLQQGYSIATLTKELYLSQQPILLNVYTEFFF